VRQGVAYRFDEPAVMQLRIDDALVVARSTVTTDPATGR
jgi:hypothetical protein